MKHSSPIDQLAEKLRNNEGNVKSFTFRSSAIIAFMFFLEMTKEGVIDEEVIAAILRDEGITT